MMMEVEKPRTTTKKTAVLPSLKLRHHAQMINALLPMEKEDMTAGLDMETPFPALMGTPPRRREEPLFGRRMAKRIKNTSAVPARV